MSTPAARPGESLQAYKARIQHDKTSTAPAHANLLTTAEIIDAPRSNGLYQDNHAFHRPLPLLEADARKIEAAVLRKNGFNPLAKGDGNG